MSYNNVNVNVSGPKQPTSTYKTKVLKGNHSFASQVTEPNMKYVIKHDFDLGGESVTIPANCILEFDGGSLRNGTITGNNTYLLTKENSLNVLVEGIFTNDVFYASHFGIHSDTNSIIATERLQSILNLYNSYNDRHYSVILDWNGHLEIDNPLQVNNNTSLIGSSSICTGLTKEKDETQNVDAVVIVQGYDIEVRGLRFWFGNEGYGVYCKDMTNSKISDLRINGYNVGLHLEHCWKNKIEDVTINACEIGFQCDGPATSILVERLFIQHQKLWGIRLSGLAYSTFINCANDAGEKGIACRAYNSEVSFVNCGVESKTLCCLFTLDRARLNIIGGTYAFGSDQLVSVDNLPQAAINSMSAIININSATFTSGDNISDYPFFKDATSQAYNPTELSITNCYYTAGYADDVLQQASNQYAVKIVKNHDGNYLVKNSRKQLGSQFDSLFVLDGSPIDLGNNTNKNFTDNTRILFKNASKNAFSEAVKLSDGRYYLGTVSDITEDSDYYYITVKNNERSRKFVKEIFGYTKSNNYIICAHSGTTDVEMNGCFYFADSITGNSVQFTLKCKKDIINICNINDRIFATRCYLNNSTISRIDENETSYNIIVNYIVTDSVLPITNNSIILGVNTGAAPFVAYSNISFNHTNKTITCNKSGCRGTITTSTKLYYFSQNGFNSLAYIPYVMHGNENLIRDCIRNGLFAKGQMGYGFNKNKLIVAHDTTIPRFTFTYDWDSVWSNSSFPSSGVNNQIFWNTSYKKFIFYAEGWKDIFGNPNTTRLFGTTAQRPSAPLNCGTTYIDTTIGKPIWWLINDNNPNGVWVDATGATV